MHFHNIVGHKHQIEALIKASEDNRVSHAYLFAGPSGIGKKLIAIEFSKLLNCTDYKPKEKTNSDLMNCECISCRKIDKSIHPDVSIVQFEGVRNIKVEQIREGIEGRLYLRPYEGKYKVVIVDEAERMNVNSQGAFLKTLEEPPPDTVIILISSEPNLLLPTILSRCQIINFNKFSDEIIFDYLRTNKNLNEMEARVLSRISDGSIGNALSLQTESLEKRKELISALSAIDSNSGIQVLGFVEGLPKTSSSEDEERLKFILKLISLWLRDVVLIKIGLDHDKIVNTDILELTKKAADRWSTEQVLSKIDFLEDVWKSIFRENANKQMALENLVLNITE